MSAGELCRRARESGLAMISFEGPDPIAVCEDGRLKRGGKLADRWVATLRRAVLAERDGAINHERAALLAAQRLVNIMARPSTEWYDLGYQEAYRDLVNALSPLEAYQVIPVADSWIGGAK